MKNTQKKESNSITINIHCLFDKLYVKNDEDIEVVVDKVKSGFLDVIEKCQLKD